MKYWLVSHDGIKKGFYSLVEIFKHIEKVDLTYCYSSRHYSICRLVGQQFQFEIGSHSGFESENKNCYIHRNYSKCYYTGYFHKAEVCSLISSNKYIITDIHGYSVDIDMILDRYSQRYGELFGSKSTRKNRNITFGFKSCKNQVKRRRQYYRSARLRNELSNLLSLDEQDKQVRVRAKRVSDLKDSFFWGYEYNANGEGKSWKCYKNRKQWE